MLPLYTVVALIDPYGAVWVRRVCLDDQDLHGRVVQVRGWRRRVVQVRAEDADTAARAAQASIRAQEPLRSQGVRVCDLPEVLHALVADRSLTLAVTWEGSGNNCDSRWWVGHEPPGGVVATYETVLEQLVPDWRDDELPAVQAARLSTAALTALAEELAAGDAEERAEALSDTEDLPSPQALQAQPQKPVSPLQSGLDAREEFARATRVARRLGLLR